MGHLTGGILHHPAMGYHPNRKGGGMQQLQMATWMRVQCRRTLATSTRVRCTGRAGTEMVAIEHEAPHRTFARSTREI
jgi:hypothetical protein